jgi:ATP-dependent RNA helicase DDX10/DBP4
LKDQIDGSVRTFDDLPLSTFTKSGLKTSHFTILTEIQSRIIPLALKGIDLLGAAKTGSGKTLAFLVPVLENLYRAQFVGPDAGLGAMIITPTRELAIQIFEILRKVGGRGHLFAAGLVIGGKSLKEEQDALTRMNIVICTPGRILQHLSETASFNVDNLKMLVLDEADRILDMGFQRDVDAIIDYLPKERQTLLFSATQTKKVSDLARLSLRDPTYISVHEDAPSATPQTLQQSYILTPLPEKLDTLWSFLQSSKKSKILVFLSSGKQVRFVYESFRRLQPGIPLLHLHGRQKQTGRLQITTQFSHAKYSCLLATDVVARGIDFPAVDWVVQVDCPEDADTYIHRVGRTARAEKEGRAVLFLEPSEEEGMLQRLEKKRIPIERISVRLNKQKTIKDQLQNMCFKDPELKYLGQKAFISYAKSVHLQKDKGIFKLDALDLGGFAEAIGLPGMPRIKLRKGDNAKERKNAPHRALYASSSDEDEIIKVEDATRDGGKTKPNNVRTKYDRMFARKNQDILTSHYTNLIQEEENTEDDIVNSKGQQHAPLNVDATSDEEGDFMAIKRRIGADEELDEADYTHGSVLHRAKRAVHIAGAKEPVLVDSKRREKLLSSKKGVAKLRGKGTKLIFDDNGNAHQIYELEDENAFIAKGAPEAQRQDFVKVEKGRVQLADIEDKALAKAKRKQKKEKRRIRERMEAGLPVDDNSANDEVEPDGRDVYANFVADAQLSERDEDLTQNTEEVVTTSKGKGWFGNESDDEERSSKKYRRSKTKRAVQQLETFADLEAIAANLLESR